jgi:hypothetical protein
MFAELSNRQLTTFRYAIWNNPKDDTSLRLSLAGYKFVVLELKLKAYQFEMKRVLANKHLLLLERYFQGMYYLLGAHKIVVFDEQEASMLSLMDGDLATYLENLGL